MKRSASETIRGSVDVRTVRTRRCVVTVLDAWARPGGNHTWTRTGEWPGFLRRQVPGRDVPRHAFNRIRDWLRSPRSASRRTAGSSRWCSPGRHYRPSPAGCPDSTYLIGASHKLERTSDAW